MAKLEGDALIRHVIELHVKLRLTGELFDNSASDQRRSIVLLSLGAIGDFLRGTVGPEDGSVYKPLNQLIYALIDLERGKESELLGPAKISHRPRDPLAELAFRAFAAAAMDLLVLGKMPRKDAARRVATSLHRTGYRQSSGRAISAQQIEDWRDHFRAERPSEDEPTARFHRVKQQLLALHPSDPVSAAEHLLKHLPGAVPPKIPKKPPS